MILWRLREWESNTQPRNAKQQQRRGSVKKFSVFSSAEDDMAGIAQRDPACVKRLGREAAAFWLWAFNLRATWTSLSLCLFDHHCRNSWHYADPYPADLNWASSVFTRKVVCRASSLSTTQDLYPLCEPYFCMSRYLWRLCKTLSMSKVTVMKPFYPHWSFCETLISTSLRKNQLGNVDTQSLKRSSLCGEFL